MAEYERTSVTLHEGITGALEGLRFPATRDEVLAHARARGAKRKILDSLENVPDGTRFGSVADVIHTVGGPDSGEMPA